MKDGIPGDYYEYYINRWHPRHSLPVPPHHPIHPKLLLLPPNTPNYPPVHPARLIPPVELAWPKEEGGCRMAAKIE